MVIHLSSLYDNLLGVCKWPQTNFFFWQYHRLLLNRCHYRLLFLWLTTTTNCGFIYTVTTTTTTNTTIIYESLSNRSIILCHYHLLIVCVCVCVWVRDLKSCNLWFSFAWKKIQFIWLTTTTNALEKNK